MLYDIDLLIYGNCLSVCKCISSIKAICCIHLDFGQMQVHIQAVRGKSERRRIGGKISLLWRSFTSFSLIVSESQEDIVVIYLIYSENDL